MKRQLITNRDDSFKSSQLQEEKSELRFQKSLKLIAKNKLTLQNPFFQSDGQNFYKLKLDQTIQKYKKEDRKKINEEQYTDNKSTMMIKQWKNLIQSTSNTDRNIVAIKKLYDTFSKKKNLQKQQEQLRNTIGLVDMSYQYDKSQKYQNIEIQAENMYYFDPLEAERKLQMVAINQGRYSSCSSLDNNIQLMQYSQYLGSGKNHIGAERQRRLHEQKQFIKFQEDYQSPSEHLQKNILINSKHNMFRVRPNKAYLVDALYKRYSDHKNQDNSLFMQGNLNPLQYSKIKDQKKNKKQSENELKN